MLNTPAFLPGVLAFAISTVLIGCGGGGGGSAASGPNVTTPPVDGGNQGSGTESGPGGGTEPKSSYGYNPNDFAVAEPNTSENKVKIGVMDTGVRNNKYLNHSVQKVLKYIEDYQAGTITVQDLTNAGINVQDLSSTYHGTLVAEVIAGKIPVNATPTEKGMKEGLAKDIAELYGVRTSDSNGGLGLTSANFQAMLDLNKKYGVKLFNASFGTPFFYDEYKNKLIQYAAELANGGSLVVFSTGNGGAAIPNPETLLPVGRTDIEKGFLAVTGLNNNGTALYKAPDGTGANACGAAARWCLAAAYQYGPIYSEYYNNLVYFVGTSAAAPQVTSAAALVWSKYPWMTADQVRQTLLTTANYIPDGSNQNPYYNATSGWGALNVQDALKGPEQFNSIFSANFDANVTKDLSIFSNNIFGDAGLIKNGAGTLVMAGNSTYAGATTINGGKLQITGSLTSNVNVNSRGTLSGRGQVGAVVNNGRVSTEDGRLTVKGNYTQGANGTYVYSLNNYLTVDGKANLAGTLQVTAKNREMVTEGSHDVLIANEVTGQFSQYQSVSPFLTVTDLTQKIDKVAANIKFADAATAGTVNGGISTASGELTNQLMAKANSQALSDQITPLTDYVASLQQASTNADVQMILNSNSGALFAETPSVLLRNDTLANAQIAQRSHQVTKQGVTGVWAGASYLENTNKASGWDQVDSETRVLTVGADTQVADNSILGAYLSSYKEDSKFSASNGKSESELTTLGLYGKWNSQTPWYIAANLQYGMGDTEFNRTVFNGTDYAASHAEADLDKYGLYAELGYHFNPQQFSITPYAAWSHNSVSLDAVKESSEFGVAVNQVTAKENKVHIGGRMDYALTENLTVGSYTEYAYAFDRSLPNVGLSSNIDQAIAVNYQAPEFDKDFLLYGIGFNYLSPRKQWNFFGDVAGNALRNEDYQLQVGVKYAF